MIAVLYVDDEPDLLEIGKLFMEQDPEFSVDTTMSALAALEKIQQKQYDAILSDYQMPEMDGIQFLQIVRDRGDRIPFIIFTGRGREEVIIKALNYGVDFYLQKGGDPKAQFAELNHVVGKAVRQRRADDALRKSEEKYRSILENIQDVYYRTDQSGSLILASPSIATVLGYDAPSDLYGEDIATTLYLDPEDRKKFLSDLERSGPLLNYEVVLKKRDGTPLYVSTSSHKYFDDDGRFLGVEGVFRDITEKKKAEDSLRQAYEKIAAGEEKLRTQLEELRAGQDALRKSERKLEQIVNGSPIPQFVLDKDHTVIAWNAALERYSGIRAEDVIGTKQHWRAFYPKERPCMADLLVDNLVGKIPEWYAGKYNRSKYVEGGYEATDFFPHMGTKGTWLYFTASVLKDAKGAITGAVETLEDITETKNAQDQLIQAYEQITASDEELRAQFEELKFGQVALRESERKLQGIVNGSPIPQFVIDRDHTIISWNRALERYSGLKAGDMIGTKRQWKAFYPEERPCMADLLVDNRVERIPQWYAGKFKKSLLIPDAYEAIDFFPHMGRSGTWLFFTAAPIRDENGVVMGAVETLEDVTDEKRSEDALRLINRKLNLLSSITRHDILNQLTALSGYLELLKDRVSDEKTSSYIATCEAAARNIEHQIIFTRQYQDIGLEKPKWQNLRDTILQAESETDGIPVTTDPGLGSIDVYADPLLVRVFYNLMENAMRHGQPLTRVSFSGTPGPDGYILACEDDGIGVKAEDKERIFDRGFGKHTGFGLFLAREILSITGLTIRECGTEGAGARFEIGIPKGMFRRTGSS